MNDKQSTVWYVARRGELLAEQFLMELSATYISSLQTADIGLDYVAFFSKKNGGSLHAIGVEVRATQQQIDGRYSMPVALIRRLRDSNLPILVIVADVKHNKLYFGWAQELVPDERKDALRNAATCTVALRKSTPTENQKLKGEIFAHAAIHGPSDVMIGRVAPRPRPVQRATRPEKTEKSSKVRRKTSRRAA